MKHDISKNTEMVALNSMSDLEIMATPPNNFSTPKKVTSRVAREVHKIRERGNCSSDSEIVDHHLETDGLTKSATSENSVREKSVKFTRQG